MQSDVWLDLINQLEFDPFAKELALNSVVLEKTNEKMVLGLDLSKENSFDEFNFESLKKTLFQSFGANAAKSDFQILIKLLQIHSPSPLEVERQRNQKQYESKIQTLQSSDEYQLVSQYFKNLKIVQVVDKSEPTE